MKKLLFFGLQPVPIGLTFALFLCLAACSSEPENTKPEKAETNTTEVKVPDIKTDGLSYVEEQSITSKSHTDAYLLYIHKNIAGMHYMLTTDRSSGFPLTITNITVDSLQALFLTRQLARREP
jgi:hypothetical protein